MLTDFARDTLFSTAWFGLMAMVWFGWAQEDPPPAWRVRLAIGSCLGVLLAIGFGVLVALDWQQPTALEDRYAWFGVLVAVEVLVAGLGCWMLHRRGQGRWMAWSVAVVVAAHFVPLAWLLSDPSFAVLGLGLLAALLAIVPRLRTRLTTTSGPVGVLILMGGTLLSCAFISGAIALSG